MCGAQQTSRSLALSFGSFGFLLANFVFKFRRVKIQRRPNQNQSGQQRKVKLLCKRKSTRWNETQTLRIRMCKIKHKLVKKHWEHGEPHCTRTPSLSKQTLGARIFDENENLSLSKILTLFFINSLSTRAVNWQHHLGCVRLWMGARARSSFSLSIFITSFRQITVFVAVSFFNVWHEQMSRLCQCLSHYYYVYARNFIRSAIRNCPRNKNICE